MQLEVVEGLEHLVAELGVADPDPGQAGLHHLTIEHPVEVEMLANLPQEIER